VRMDLSCSIHASAMAVPQGKCLKTKSGSVILIPYAASFSGAYEIMRLIKLEQGADEPFLTSREIHLTNLKDSRRWSVSFSFLSHSQTCSAYINSTYLSNRAIVQRGTSSLLRSSSYHSPGSLVARQYAYQTERKRRHTKALQ
jgi:hypothetical protein